VFVKFSGTSIIQALTDIQNGFAFLGPEVLLTFFFLFLICLDLFKSPRIKILLPYVALAGIILSFCLQLQILNNLDTYYKPVFFSGLLTSDGLALYAGLLFSVAGFFTVLLSWLHPGLGKNFKGIGEYYAFLLVLLVGLNLLAKSVNLLMLFVSLELVSIASYLLTASFRHQSQAIESGVKYILYGLLASGIMLYGMSFLYGFGGSLNFTQPVFWTNLSQLNTAFFVVIFVLTLVGFLFKVAAAPFHFWAPDVYAGAPLPIVAFFSTAPKIAGFVVIIRFLFSFSNAVSGYLKQDIFLLVGGIALLTLVIGNFTALWQQKARRLLAYSSVAHAGFLLAGLTAMATNALEAIFFYLTILVLMNFGIFLLVQLFEEKLEITKLGDLSGLGKSYPFVGVIAIVILISLTGLPPTAGFTGKLLLFTSIYQNYTLTGHSLLLTLLLSALLFTGIAFFYYIRIPYYMFFKRNLSTQKKVSVTRESIVLSLLALPLLLLFAQPAWLTELIERVIFYSKLL